MVEGGENGQPEGNLPRAAESGVDAAGGAAAPFGSRAAVTKPTPTQKASKGRTGTTREMERGIDISLKTEVQGNLQDNAGEAKRLRRFVERASEAVSRLHLVEGAARVGRASDAPRWFSEKGFDLKRSVVSPKR